MGVPGKGFGGSQQHELTPPRSLARMWEFPEGIVKAWRLELGRIAIWVPRGEDPFHGYVIRLGRPAMRYFAPGGGEVARQWHISKARDLRLWRQANKRLRRAGTEVVELVLRRKAPARAAA